MTRIIPTLDCCQTTGRELSPANSARSHEHKRARARVCVCCTQKVSVTHTQTSFTCSFVINLPFNSYDFPSERVCLRWGGGHPVLKALLSSRARLSLRTSLCTRLIVSFNEQIFGMPASHTHTQTLKSQIRSGSCLQTAAERGFYLSVYFHLTFINPHLFSFVFPRWVFCLNHGSGT